MDGAAARGGSRYFGSLGAQADLDLVLPAGAGTATAATRGGGGGGGGSGSGDGSTRGAGDLGAPATFLYKLCDILDDPQLSEHIAWNQNGDGIVVNQPAQFAKTVLPQYYKHNNFQSFVRQLNIYGFRKARQDKDSWEFKQPHFRQGQRHLLGLIRRKGGGSNVNSSSHNTGDNNNNNGNNSNNSSNRNSNDPVRKRRREGSDKAAVEETKDAVDRVTSELRAVCTRVVHLEAVMGMINHKHNHLRIESQALLRVVLSEGGQRLGEKAMEALRQLPHTSGEPEMSELLSFLCQSQDQSQQQYQHQQSHQYSRQEEPPEMQEPPLPQSRKTGSTDISTGSDPAAPGVVGGPQSSTLAGVRPDAARAASVGYSGVGGGDALASAVASAHASNDDDDDDVGENYNGNVNRGNETTSGLPPLSHRRGSRAPDDASRAPARGDPDRNFHPADHFLLGELAQAAVAAAAERAGGGSGQTSTFADDAADAVSGAADSTAGTGGGGFRNVGAGVTPRRGAARESPSVLLSNATDPPTVTAAAAATSSAAAAAAAAGPAAAAGDDRSSVAGRIPQPPSDSEIQVSSGRDADLAGIRTAAKQQAEGPGPGDGGETVQASATDVTLPELPETGDDATKRDYPEGASTLSGTSEARSRVRGESRKRPLGTGGRQGPERESVGGGGGDRRGAESGAVARSKRRAGTRK